ncbi:hypothetical protein HPC49_47770 [Pyxidicoccus fallax]|uniref:Uncharacterized protein n=1 Tax=Pyxidicoccus fallax TaxID=394095 RepID=A0A848M055_9BACT|nr:hypothetical protein [Pyxidicoccus fallax]NMO23152.1 hypothetical protein [Pyxidicoccus fallax]NPC85875.1 hypothetical protein [Pyxidicoccus fallax]
MDVKRLGIYLNDHLAGSVGGLELALRTEQENRSNPVGRYLAAFIPELKHDQSILKSVMRTLEVPEDALKARMAWASEKLGRLKLNGSLVRYSPLSRLVELEGLCVATEGRLSMWRTLARLSTKDARLSGFDFEALIARGEAQQEALQHLRARASDVAFTDEPVPFGAGETVVASS